MTYSTDGETVSNLNYSNGVMTVTGDNVTVKNVKFGNRAQLVVNTTGKFTLENCIFNSEIVYDKNKDYIHTAVKLNVVDAVVKNNIFGGVTNGYYNAIEFGIGDDQNNLSKAEISGNTFNSAIKNNYFNFYNMTDNAVIDIRNNSLLLAAKTSNGIRISNPRNAENITFNIAKDSYNYASDSAESEYEGLILLQDYSKGNDTQNFTDININIAELSAPESAKQLLYVYEDKSNSIINTNYPKLNGDDSITQFYAAKIGDKYYKSLTDAYAALPRGNGSAPTEPTTIKLLKDCAGGGIGSDGTDNYMNYIIDFGGHTYTVGAPAVGSTGTVSQGIRVLQTSTAKFMNGTLKAANYNGLVQVVHTYGNVTFEDFNVDATEDSYAWAAVEPDAGTLTISGNSSILAYNNNYGLYAAFWHVGSYNGTTVDIDTVGKITGKLAYEFDEDYSDPNKASENKGYVNIKNGYFDVSKIEEIWTDVSDNVNKSTGGISIESGYFNSDPTEYLVKGKVAGSSDIDGYAYKVIEKTENAKPAESEVTSVPVKTIKGADETTEEAAKEVKGVAVDQSSANIIDAATKDLASKNTLEVKEDTTVAGSNEKVIESLKTLTGDSNLTKDDITIVYQSYIDVTVKEEDGKNMVEVKLGDDSYSFELTDKDLTIYVESSKRVDSDDKNGIKMNVSNDTDIPVYVKVADDDTDAPRFALGSKTGTVKVY